MHIKCPTCENEIEADSSYVGTQVRCPRCKNTFWVTSKMMKGNRKLMPFILGLIFGPLGVIITALVYGGVPALWSVLGWAMWFVFIIALAA